ncbi:hypothetical protein [Shewanella sp. GD04112]|uniref:hypothetical protein n=1 Tax=Shewanella sp. GD04112 TaxID=2975434 RepID=UPI00244C3F01|nr:hypothetical protein [Shewanella sp. GD04112]MDH0450859.1 hypothetical protein [Shewanella sp. GD04112]
MASKKAAKKITGDDENVMGLRQQRPIRVHLRRHFSASKSELTRAVERSQEIYKIALCLGALDCLYWQAMGLGGIKLAKGISRLLAKSYQHHPIRVSSTPI